MVDDTTEDKNSNTQSDTAKNNGCGCGELPPVMYLVDFICLIIGVVIGAIFNSWWISIISIILLVNIANYIYSIYRDKTKKKQSGE